MFARVYMDCYWLLLLLLLLCIRVRLSSNEILIFIRYDVRVLVRSIRCSITLFALRERNFDDGRRCMMRWPGE
ncbi:uncharacterized protein BJ212DRAFT_1416535 [Suillus subaureus]|uniref:Uncharacterized protein n=1 Tax=Suillus subaureus TaxID=48587 RepID=A0A9P7DHC0_9AGAM|nr:uncharacterized protein BJ212DRAFT_1416535 [Suillus subaureus]KAG1792869.1 hypothetical protein BJ212DRAFT_1416535 [Suillus subaureus]